MDCLCLSSNGVWRDLSWEGCLRPVGLGITAKTGVQSSVATEDSKKPHRTRYCCSDGAPHTICSCLRSPHRFTLFSSSYQVNSDVLGGHLANEILMNASALPLHWCCSAGHAINHTGFPGQTTRLGTFWSYAGSRMEEDKIHPRHSCACCLSSTKPSGTWRI